MVIQRFFAKGLLVFPEVELEFSPNLVVFSGPSGAGKSVLMNSILAGFGISDGLADMSELEIEHPVDIESELYELENPSTIKLIKKSSLRCYIDGQSIPRKGLKELFGSHVHYLSVRDKGGFESERLIRLIDGALISRDPSFGKLVDKYKEHYVSYKDSIAKLEKILENERELAEKIEFATYEIEKIRKINPKEDELDELMATKRQLSRIEKISDAVKRAEVIFEAEGAVGELFGLLEKDSGYFSDAMGQLRADIEASSQLVEELSEIDVESVLDRLEQLSGLIKRHGSVGDTLEYLASKEAELAGYTHIEEDKTALEKLIANHKKILEDISAKISISRGKYATELAQKISKYLSELKLPPVAFEFAKVPLGAMGSDEVDLELQGSSTSTLSGGEHNRLRLALMASALSDTSDGQGIVILDEIDANVSGDESIAIADMISDLSRSYQVFAISHQPHLAAKASQHFLATKDSETSRAIELDDDGRIHEIARIIGGEMADGEAIAFARKLTMSQT